MTPEQIAKESEHSQQAAFFCWASMHQSEYPMLRFMHAVPNGGQRHPAVAAKLRAEGVKPGVADIFLPWPCGRFAGLYLEFKAAKYESKLNGGLSPDQIGFRNFVLSAHYEYKVAYSWLQAVDIVLKYMGINQNVSG